MIYSSAAPMPPLRVLLASVWADTDGWDTTCVTPFIEELGHVVINLGSCLSDELVIGAIGDHAPELLAVSCSNRCGFFREVRLIKTIRSTDETAHVPVVIGGKFGRGTNDDAIGAVRLRRQGYDAVFGRRIRSRSIA